MTGDEVGAFLRARWAALGRADALFTRPWLDLDAEGARARVDPEGRLGDLHGRRVLCLAGGGGQQSAAFGLLGADVTVADLDPRQLERDREAAAHHGHHVRTLEADLRDLSALDGGPFDVVHQPYSINFVPDAAAVIAAVGRLLAPGGWYVFWLANPLAAGVTTRDWTGEGYLLRRPYVDGAPYSSHDEDWVADDLGSVPAPREYRHTLGTVVGALAAAGLALVALEEHTRPPGVEPGTWEHLKSVLPPWFTLWCARGGGPAGPSGGS